MTEQHKNPRILVVEDDKTNRELLVSVLNKKGYETLESEDGLGVPARIRKEGIGLVLLDVMLPETTGYEILDELRKEFDSIELPVIMVTSKTDPQDVVRALKQGANDFVSKPINFEILMMRLSNQVKIKRAATNATKLKQIEAINALVVTYNHEIRNPLAIALGLLRKNPNERLEAALKRIEDIVAKIDILGSDGDFELEDYSKADSMIKLPEKKKAS